MEENAEKMCEASVKRFKPAEVGDTIIVPVPDVDCGRGDFPNVMAIVLEADGNGLYKLGTKSGILQQKFSRNQFDPCKQKFLKLDEIPTNVISVREAARVTSNGTGQGFFKCSCNPKRGCKDKRCKCFKASVKCNSRCHSSDSCINKHDV